MRGSLAALVVLRKTWRRWTRASPALTAPDERRRAEFLAGLFLTAVPVGSIATWVRVALDPAYLRAGVTAQLGIVFLFGLYALARSRYLALTSWLACLATLAIAVGVSLYSTEWWVLLGYATMPVVIAGILLSIRSTVVITLLCCVGLAGRGAALDPSVSSIFLSAALPFLFIVGALVMLGANLNAGLERDRRGLLEDSEARYRRVFERTFDAYAVVQGGKVVEVSSSLAQLLGRGAELIGASYLELFPSAAERVEKVISSDGALELLVPVTGGGQRELELLTSSVTKSGEAAKVVAVRDVSEKRRVERLLLASERSVALGQVAAGLAHEVNNPLAVVISSLSQLTRTEVALSSDDQSALEAAKASAERIRVLIDDLRVMASPSGDLTAEVDLDDVLALAARVATPELGRRALFEFRAHAHCRVRGNAAKLGQVFVTLLVNAAHAIPEGDVAKHRVALMTSRVGGRVQVDVTDTGARLPPEVLEHVFEPFFAAQRGRATSSLGLSTCHGIIRAHGGEMHVESSEQGSVFRVMLDVLADVLPEPARRAPPASPPSHVTTRLKVLIIDDEPMLLRTLSRVLKGHDVDVASSGEQGLVMAREHDYDAILCDISMPRVSGVDVFRALEHDGGDKHQRMVLMTGGAFTPESRAFLETFRGTIVGKPFDDRVVVSAVKSAAANRRAT